MITNHQTSETNYLFFYSDFGGFLNLDFNDNKFYFEKKVCCLILGLLSRFSGGLMGRRKNKIEWN